MEREVGADLLLDRAVFQISSAQNRYETLIYGEGKRESLACGPLDQLALHLPQAKDSSRNSFKLELSRNFKDSAWFTKFTLARFLGVIHSPDALQSANTIANEISQLEDTRRFHLSLYSKDHPDQFEGKVAGGDSKVAGLTNIKVETGSSDATKNELLRAVELRLLVLKEELIVTFNRAAGAILSVKQISDLAKFAEHFEVRDLREPLSKYLSFIPEDQLVESSVEKNSDDAKKTSQDISTPDFGKAKPISISVSPAKIAQAERQSSTESENSDSSDEDQTYTERSRPVMRSATPRRSASPMRRVQIGRSGSRRSTALAIKSLGYFPPRERIISNRDADGNSSGDEQADQPAKKPDNSVRRMSVQEAISLFESKQKDQNLDAQKKRASGEVSLNTSKAVLRRWSSGMSDSQTRDQENVSEAISQSNPSNLLTPEDGRLTDVKIETNVSPGNLNASSETAQVVPSPEVDMMITKSKECGDSISPHAEQIDEKVTVSLEWSKQKEEELNQMLMKMMDSKPGKYRSSNTMSTGSLSTSNDQRGGFYSQYRAKRDEKLRSEKVKKHSVMEAQLKVLQETLKPSKAELAPKSRVTTKKVDNSVHSQQPRRNSSPPVLNKKEVSKPATSKKASLKSSPSPTTRASWSGPLQKASGVLPAKSSPRVSSTVTTPSRRKSQPISPVASSPKTERPLHQSKGKPEAKNDVKPTTRGQGEKKPKSATNANRTVKTKAPQPSADDSGSGMTKPSFYNKVTRKSSVVPLEAKPVKKGAGTKPAATSPAKTKSRITQPDVSSKRSDNSIQAEEKEEPTRETTEPADKVLEVDLAQQANDVDANLVTSLDNDLNLEKTEQVDESLAELDSGNKISVEPVAEIQPDEDISISSAAWVEVEQQELTTAYNTAPADVSASSGLVPQLSSSPRVRHSLSQMLQADSNEPDVIEWGNAENPPALIYHKDAPKGFKRLLKFARKSKGEANVTGWASPSVFSEGEDDAEDLKAASKKHWEASRKMSLQAKGYVQQKSMLNESLHDGPSSKSSVEYQGVHDVLSGSDKFREGHISSAATSTKAARSFFSLSTFRSNKSNETKPR